MKKYCLLCTEYFLNRMRQSWTISVHTVFVIASLFLLSACQIDFKEHGLRPQKVGIYAGGAQTRTQMLPNGLSAAWEADDELALWAMNSSGSYVISNQIFKSYGLDGQSGYFTSTLADAMPDGTYTYYCCYPAPVSLNGTRATFSLPSLQDGRASGGADIMIADPVQHGPLTDDYQSSPALQMNRMTHHFRFWIPAGANTLGEDINRIEVTMPDNIAGDFIADLSDPGTESMLGNGTKTVTLELDEPLGESADFSNASFAYLTTFPHQDTYADGDYMKITVYTNSFKSVLDPIPLSGRSFLPGHSTPVKIYPTSATDYCRLTIHTGMNNIGESLWNIRISSGGNTLFQYSNTSGAYHNITYSEEYLGAGRKAEYEAVVNAVANGTAVLNFETANASVDIPMTSDMMVRNGNSAELYLGDVPYLLYEDFSSAAAFGKNDAYSGGSDSDTGSGGVLLDGKLPSTGWNAARVGLLEGDCVRINCRYEGAVMAYRKYCGRIDTPAFKYLKSGASVDVVIEYDKAFYIPAGYNLDTSSAKAKYYVGYHTKSETSAINGIQIGNTSESNITGNATIVYTSGVHASENVGKMTHHTAVIPNATSSTRAVFYVNTTETTIKFLGMNACYYLYLDNIKVYINGNN